MGLRFRKSIKLAPGVRMNLGMRGVGFSVGPRGASVSVSSRGVYGNAGIPGTGLSYRTRLDAPAPRRASMQALAPPAPAETVSVNVTVTDDGDVVFKDSAGNPLSPAMIAQARKQYGAALGDLLLTACNTVNAHIESVGEIHRETPSPLERPRFLLAPFDESAPAFPVIRKPSWLIRWLPWVRRRAELEAERQRAAHAAALAGWQARLASHEASEAARRELIEVRLLSDMDAMDDWLEARLQEIDWPRETMVSVDIREEGALAMIDVDLPEVEDMPAKQARVPVRGLRLLIKEMSPSAVQRLYMRHVHGIGFRIIGEAFASLPTLQRVVLAGYSQRRSKATGQVDDEYLYSVMVDREAWSRLDFTDAGLEALDVVEALSQFELRRNMSKTGLFKAIRPHADDLSSFAEG